MSLMLEVQQQKTITMEIHPNSIQPIMFLDQKNTDLGQEKKNIPLLSQNWNEYSIAKSTSEVQLLNRTEVKGKDRIGKEKKEETKEKD